MSGIIHKIEETLHMGGGGHKEGEHKKEEHKGEHKPEHKEGHSNLSRASDSPIDRLAPPELCFLMADDGKQATKTDGGEAREERQENPGGAAGDGVAPVASDGGGDGSGRSREGSDGGEEEAAAVAAAAAQELPQANPRSSSRTPFNIHAFHVDPAELESDGIYIPGEDDDFEDPDDETDDEDNDFEDPDDETDDEDNDVEGSYDGTDMDDEDAFDVDAAEDANGGSNQAAELESENFSIGVSRMDRPNRDRYFNIHDFELDPAEDANGGSNQAAELESENLSRGLSADTIASLSSVSYKTGSSQNGTNDLCVICQFAYKDGEMLTVLSCKHSYHSECINTWLQIKKVCPLCSAEVSGSANS